MRMILSFAAAILLALAISPQQASRAAGGTSISGGRLPHPIQFTPADDDALVRRVNTPPTLDNPPVTSGTSYTLESSYWSSVVRGPGRGDAPADPAAAYFPEGGFVRARRAGNDVWLVLDLRQRAIVDRYIRLGEGAALGPKPAQLGVLAAAASMGEDIGVQLGAVVLTSANARAFFLAAASLGPPKELSPPEAPMRPSDGVWLVFTLSEGRSVQMRYMQSDRSLVDLLGFERYTVDSAFARVISTFSGAPTVLPIGDQGSPGSPVWWFAGLTLGVGALLAAFWIEKHLRPQEAP